MTDPAAGQRALDRALAQVEDAREVVGRDVPAWAREWAEKNGLDVLTSEFAPPGALFLTGSFRVDGIHA